MRNFLKLAFVVTVILTVVKLFTDWPEGVLDIPAQRARAVLFSTNSVLGANGSLTRLMPGGDAAVTAPKAGDPEEYVISKSIYKNKYFGFSFPMPPLWLVTESKEAAKQLKSGPAWLGGGAGSSDMKKGDHLLLMCTKGRTDIYGQQDNVFFFILASQIQSNSATTPQMVETMELNSMRSDGDFDSIITNPEEFTLGGRPFARMHVTIKSPYVAAFGSGAGKNRSDVQRMPSIISGHQESQRSPPVHFVVFATIKDGYVLQFLLMSKNEDALSEGISHVRQLEFDPS